MGASPEDGPGLSGPGLSSTVPRGDGSDLRGWGQWVPARGFPRGGLGEPRGPRWDTAARLLGHSYPKLEQAWEERWEPTWLSKPESTRQAGRVTASLGALGLSREGTPCCRPETRGVFKVKKRNRILHGATAGLHPEPESNCVRPRPRFPGGRAGSQVSPLEGAGRGGGELQIPCPPPCRVLYSRNT